MKNEFNLIIKSYPKMSLVNGCNYLFINDAEMYNQISNDFYLDLNDIINYSNLEETRSLRKEFMVISDIKSFSLNTVNNLKELYKSLTAQVDDEILLKYSKINSEIQELLLQLISGIDIEIEVDKELDIKKLLKAMSIRVHDESQPVSNLMQLINFLGQFDSYRKICIINGLSYFSFNQIEEMESMALFQGLQLLFIERYNNHNLVNNDYRNVYLIDDDYCFNGDYTA